MFSPELNKKLFLIQMNFVRRSDVSICFRQEGETELSKGILAVVLDVNRRVYLRVRWYRRMKTYIRTGSVFLLVFLYSLFYPLFQVLQESEKKIQMCEIIIQQRGASPLKGKVV